MCSIDITTTNTPVKTTKQRAEDALEGSQEEDAYEKVWYSLLDGSRGICTAGLLTLEGPEGSSGGSGAFSQV
ncbi:hypothetical protein ANANG_G00069400 [Anguilla anguilla]|uniref:Uncharacterized protein n=1 Tax=Anguilla anguilla TaxID=7936 RepID=A0A9D3MUI1_ANGAN|nr:hypothetical protein ANANG_G00069400 [Anguilla anguilla]